MQMLGVSNEQLAKETGATPSQLSLFFKGEGASLKTKELDKCLEVLDINIGIYSERYNLACKAANILKDKYKVKDVLTFTKEQMVKATGLKEIELFIDCNKDEFERIKISKIADKEATFPFFKSLVLKSMGITGTNTMNDNAKSIKNLFLAAGIGSAIISSPILAITLGGVLPVLTMVAERTLTNSHSNKKKN